MEFKLGDIVELMGVGDLYAIVELNEDLKTATVIQSLRVGAPRFDLSFEVIKLYATFKGDLNEL